MKKIIKNIDKPLLIISALLFIIGLIMIFSASNVTAYMKYSASPYRYFFKQFIFLFISILLSLFLINFHSKTYKFFSNILMLIMIPILLFLLLYGSVKNQAISWIDLGFMSIQPSEFAKVILIVYLATYYEKSKSKLDNIIYVFRPFIIPIIVAFLILKQPDLGTATIFMLIAFFIFLIEPISKKIKNRIIFSGGIVVITLLVVLLAFGDKILETRQFQRFDYFEPCSKEKFYSTGNQVCNGYIAINNGGLFGVGLGNSTQKYLYLPEAHTDFIFAIIVEELGVLISSVIFVLYFLLLGRIIKIGKESYTDRGAVICYGVAFYIFLHIFINLAGIFGLIPLTGVPLPFMSYGGSFTMCLVISLMLVQRVNIENRLYENKMLKNKNK